MIVGIPKESWRDERRVALTPAGTYALAKAGHTIMVQAEAGAGSSFTAEAYRGAGATIVFSPEEVFARADLVVKVMPPTVEECGWIPDNKFLFSVVHLGSTNPKIHEMLRSRQVMAVGLELMEDSERRLPVVTAMGEIAGMLLPQIAGRLLESTHGGRGVLLGGVTGIPAARVVIVGAGNVGSTAARVFLGVGANITVMDHNLKQLRQIEIYLSKAVDTMLATPYNLEHCVRSADVIVGAVMIHGHKTPHVVTDAMVREMRPGS